MKNTQANGGFMTFDSISSIRTTMILEGEGEGICAEEMCVAVSYLKMYQPSLSLAVCFIHKLQRL